MPIQFDEALKTLKSKLMEMSRIATKMLEDVSTALDNWNMDGFVPVVNAEKEMDRLQSLIDEETIRMIGVFTPVAGDLRFLLMVTRINAELERIGDQAMNICFYSKTMMKGEPVKIPEGFQRMAKRANKMITGVMDAFMTESSAGAKEIIVYDDKVDWLHDEIFRELAGGILKDPDKVTQGVELILIARAFKRIADHAVAIAEDVVFIVEGRDIRHTDFHLEK